MPLKQDNLSVMKAAARNSTAVFVGCFLDMPAPAHIQEWYTALDNPAITRILIKAPRKHAKSTAITQNWVLKAILYNPLLRVLIVSRSDGFAMQFQRYINNALRMSKKIQAAFTECYPLIKETDHEVILKRAVNLKDPSVAVVGRGGSVTGRTVDVLVIDDIIDRKDAYSPSAMDKVWDWMTTELFNTLEPDGRIVVVGTAKREDDIYARLADRWSKEK